MKSPCLHFENEKIKAKRAEGTCSVLRGQHVAVAESNKAVAHALCHPVPDGRTSDPHAPLLLHHKLRLLVLSLVIPDNF